MMRARHLRFSPEPVRDAGYVLALGALLILPLVAFVGLAVDLGAWTTRAEQIKQASAASALSGASYMPSTGTAESQAILTAAKNGFVDGADGITVTARAYNGNRVEVTIRDDNVDQFFTSLFIGQTAIERTSTAEFIKPVPMGSPKNFLGTDDEMPAAADQENFFLAIQGYCSRREHGDRIAPFSDSNGSAADSAANGFEGCDPGAGGQLNVRENPEYTADGYFYGIEFKTGQPGAAYNVAVRDAAFCGSGQDSGSPGDNSFTYQLRSNDNFDPTLTSVLATTTVPRQCGDPYEDKWVDMFTISSPTTGIYYLQVLPVIPADPDQSGQNSREGNNLFGLAVYDSGIGSDPSNAPGTWSWMCTTNSDEETPNVPLNANCPNVFGQSHLGIFVRSIVGAPASPASASFYLAEIQQAHQGRTVVVELFDSAEGMEYVEILDPDDNVVSFDWEVACQDSSYISESGACTTGENAPNGGYSEAVALTTQLDVSGNWDWDDTTPHCRWRPWGIDNSDSPSTGCRNHQTGKYSDRLIRLKFQLPTSGDFAPGGTWYPGGDWFRIRYTTESNPGDRTTWSVSILGDPVRLVENAPAP